MNQTLTVKQLAQQVKRKYPQYSQVDDEQLGFRILEKYPQYKKRVNTSEYEGVSGFIDGATNSAKSAVQGLQQFGSKILDNTAGRIGKGLATGDYSATDGQTKGKPFANQNLENYTTAQKFGNFTGEVAQFAIPGGAITKTGKAAGLANRAKVAGKLGTGKANTVAERVTDYGSRGLVEGTQYAGIEGVTSGGFDKDEVDVAIMSSLFPGAGAALKAGKRLTSKGKDELAGRFINSFVKPRQKDFAYGKNPGRTVAREKIVANSLEDIQPQIQNRLDVRKNELNVELAKADAKGAGLEMFDSTMKTLDDKIATLKETPNEYSSVITRLEGLKDDLTLIVPTERLSLVEASGLKTRIGGMTKFTGNPSDDLLVNQTKQELYGLYQKAIEREAAKTVKGLDVRAKNAVIGDLISAREAVKHRAQIAQRQNLTTFTDNTAALTGVVSGIAIGELSNAVIFGMGAVVFNKAWSSPAFKTRVASYLSSASDAEKRKLFEKAPWVKAAVIENSQEIIDLLIGGSSQQ